MSLTTVEEAGEAVDPCVSRQPSLQPRANLEMISTLDYHTSRDLYHSWDDPSNI